MDAHYLRLTKPQLEAILDAAKLHAPTLITPGMTLAGTQMVNDSDLKAINEELTVNQVVGPVVVIDMGDPNGMNPPHLAAAFNSITNYLQDIAEEAKKAREAVEHGASDLSQKLDDINATIGGSNSYGAIISVRDAVRAVADAAILSQPLPAVPGERDDRIDEAANRVLEALQRRPDLEAAVRAKINGL